MIPESGEKSHGEEAGATPGRISEAVLY